jgi:hypothetical protein
MCLATFRRNILPSPSGKKCSWKQFVLPVYSHLPYHKMSSPTTPINIFDAVRTTDVLEQYNWLAYQAQCANQPLRLWFWQSQLYYVSSTHFQVGRYLVHASHLLFFLLSIEIQYKILYAQTRPVFYLSCYTAITSVRRLIVTLGSRLSEALARWSFSGLLPDERDISLSPTTSSTDIWLWRIQEIGLK